MKPENKPRGAAGIAVLTDDELTHATGGRASVRIPEAAAPHVMELVATGKARGIGAASVR